MRRPRPSPTKGRRLIHLQDVRPFYPVRKIELDGVRIKNGVTVSFEIKPVRGSTQYRLFISFAYGDNKNEYLEVEFRELFDGLDIPNRFLVTARDIILDPESGIVDVLTSLVSQIAITLNESGKKDSIIIEMWAGYGSFSAVVSANGRKAKRVFEIV